MHRAIISQASSPLSYLFTLIILSLPAALAAQDLQGLVLGLENGEYVPLPGAHVTWIGVSGGTATDAQGQFTLHGEDISDRRVLVRHVAFEPLTVAVGEKAMITIRLSEQKPYPTEEVEISADAPDTYIAPMTPKTEVITSEELEHAACCDLAGCFGTTSAVQSEAVDIITDTKQLTMLGLDGVYTQVLVDNTPNLVTGLNTHFGVSFIPGPFIDQIFVSKGANSVLQGSASFSGQINVIMHESDENKPLFFNAFVNSFLQQQYNAYLMRTSGAWSGMLAAQGIRRGARIDRNNDSFLDAPLTDRFSVLAKWKYDGADEGIISRNGFKYTWEDRLGGQKGFDPDLHSGGTAFYGQWMKNRRIEFYDRTEIAIGDDQSLILHGTASTHTQDALYGTTGYDADEQTASLQASYAIPWADDQELTAGVSYRFSELDETIDLGSNPHDKSYAGRYGIRESVPGLFAENTSYFLEDALSVVAGLRADFHNEYGNIITPRSFVRYDLGDQTTLRASVGTAFRVVRPFAENPSVLASWRDIRLPDRLDAERALNYGINLTRYYDASPLTGTISVDAYRTEFSQQVIAEYDDDPSAIIFRNLEGSSASDNLMAEVTAEITWLTARLSYTYTDAYEVRNGTRRSIPFVPKHRVLSVFTASTAGDAWQGTFTIEWRGAQKLPETDTYPLAFQLPERSDPYTVLNLHVQRKWETFDVYAGVENLLDFRQDNPIINASNPFDRYFEPAFAWGPVKGREFYAGIRARLNVFE